MPQPTPNWDLIEVRGRYVGTDGGPISGRIIFTPKATRLVDQAAVTTLIGRAISVKLEDGNCTILLPATDDPDVTPTNFTYTVTEDFVGGSKYDIEVPLSAATDGIELALAAPASGSPGISDIDITRMELVEYISSSEAARDEAVAAKVAAQAVGTTNDTVIASRINDQASATRTALSATIASEVPPRVDDYLASSDVNVNVAAAAVEAAVTGLDLVSVETEVSTDPDRIALSFDDSDPFAYFDETDGLVDTRIEGALVAPIEGYGTADVDQDAAGRHRLTSVLTSGPNIVCKGDSIARAWAPELAIALAVYGYPGRVLNYSVGGENTPTILARTGGSPFLATVSGGVIPASGGVSVTLSEATSGLDADLGDTPRLNPLAQAPDGFNPCTLIGDNGVRVVGEMVGHAADGSNPFTFTRLAAGSTVPAAYATPVVTWAAQNTMHDIQIIAVGQNDDGTVLNYTLRFDMIQQLIDRMQAGKKRYLVLTAFSGGPGTRSAEEAEARRRWGRHAILTRPWLASYAALAAVAVTPTTADDTNIAAGNVADSFFTSPDFVHPNAVGRTALIRLILNRLIELEWI